MMLRNTKFICRVEPDILTQISWDIMFNTAKKSGISAHPLFSIYVPTRSDKLLLKNNRKTLRFTRKKTWTKIIFRLQA